MARAVDGWAANGAVKLATRDYGGDGPDLLFIPGAGQTLVDCHLLAPWLTQQHRVVAMDLRGHGRSDDGTFTWEAALDDVDAVVAGLALEQPAVVGHSLGGMIAAMYGAHRPSLGVVNLDGHGEPRAQHYDDKDRERFAQRMQELRLLGEGALSQPIVLPLTALEAMVGQYQARFGLDEALVRAALARSYIDCDGGVRARMSLELTLEILACVRSLDFVAMYRSCQVPLLVVNAIQPDPTPPGAPAWMDEHLTGFRRGVSAELARLSEELPTMAFVEVDATHALIYEHPELVAKHAIAFLAK